MVVKEHTRITGRPQDYEVEAGDTATFRCNAVYDSDLRLKIKWLKDGELIDFDTEPRFVQSSDQSLTITKTTELDSGTYTCLAESELDRYTGANKDSPCKQKFGGLCPITLEPLVLQISYIPHWKALIFSFLEV